MFWDTRHHSDFLSHFFVVAALISEKKWKKIHAHPISLTREEFWDTRHYSDFSQKKEERKKKERKKKSEKKSSRVCFSLIYVQRRDFVSVLGSRL